MTGILRKTAHGLGYGAAAALRKLTAAAFLALAPLSALAAPVVVAALGDSLTQGYGLPPGAGFVPQLEAWLRERGHDVEVLNAGVSGDTTAGGAARVDWTLTSEVDALIVALGGNDLLRGIDPMVSRANLERILAAARSRGVPVLLIGMVAPGNFGPDYKAAFDGMYPQLAARHDTLLVADFLGALREAQARDPGAMATLMQGDGLHPSRRGVALIVEAIGPKAAELADRARR